MDSDPKPVTDPTDDCSLPAEIRALMGVYALGTQVQAAIEAIESGTDLTEPARRLLVRLDRPVRMGELARVTKLLPSTITAQVDHLEQHGLVQRQRDPSDRRAWILSLTQRGEAVRTDMVSEASELFHKITGFDAKETEAFATLADKARRNILDKILSGSHT